MSPVPKPIREPMKGTTSPITLKIRKINAKATNKTDNARDTDDPCEHDIFGLTVGKHLGGGFATRSKQEQGVSVLRGIVLEAVAVLHGHDADFGQDDLFEADLGVTDFRRFLVGAEIQRLQ